MTPDGFREDWSNRSAFIDRGLRCEPVEGFRGAVCTTCNNTRVRDGAPCVCTGEAP